MAKRALLYLAVGISALALGGCCDGPFGVLFPECSTVHARLTANPDRVAVGQQTVLTGRVTEEDTGKAWDSDDIDEFAWDFDGDGRADLVDDGSTGLGRPESTQTPAYSALGRVSPAFVAIVDSHEQRDTATTHVTVGTEGNDAPVARLSLPPSVHSGEEFTADGSASSDSNGTIVHYLWDFTADGQTDVDTGMFPRATWTYEVAGTHDVRLRVVDDEGATGVIFGTTRVTESSSPTGPGVAAAAAAKAFRATLLGDLVGRLPRPSRRGTLHVWNGLRGAGTLKARLPGRRLRGLLAARWRTRLKLTFDSRTLTGRLSGIALTRPRRHARHGEWGCLSFSLRVPAFRAPRGTLRLLGGSGRYSRLRVRGSFTPTVGAKRVGMKGTVRAGRGARHGLPRRCRALLR